MAQVFQGMYFIFTIAALLFFFISVPSLPVLSMDFTDEEYRQREGQKRAQQEDIEEDSPSIESFKWVPCLNALYKGKFAFDEGKYSIDSHRMADWHINQADMLAYFYNTYQGGAARNVLRAMFSLIYMQNNTLKIKHYMIDDIFMSGWLPEDTPLGHYKGSYIELPSYPKHTKKTFSQKNSPLFEKTKISTLGTVFKDNKITFDGFLVKQGLTTQTEINAAFKEQECHSEKTTLFYLNFNLDKMLSYFLDDMKDRFLIKDFVLNMASYRDMCLICMNSLEEKNRTYPMERLESKIIEKLTSSEGKFAGKVRFTSTPKVIICFSSISPHSMEERNKSGYTQEARPRHYKWIHDLKAHKFYLMENPYVVTRIGKPQDQDYHSKLSFIPVFFRTENYERPLCLDNKWEETNHNQ